MARTSIKLLAGMSVLLLTVAACGSDGSSDGSSDAGSSGTAAKSLAGTDWVLTAMTPAVPELSGVTVTARFADGVLSGSSGCNTYRTGYAQTGSELTIDPEIVSTRIACPGGPSAVEQAYLDRLPQTASFVRTSSTLTLRDDADEELLAFATAPAGLDAIVGDWNATSLFTGNAVESPTGAKLTATFVADGSVSGSGGCNTFTGQVEVDGSSITIGPLASTQMACTDEAVSQQEQQYFAALDAASAFEIVGERLTLLRDDGGIAVVYEGA